MSNKKYPPHPGVSEFMKNVFDYRPTKPKYTFIWDVQGIRFHKIKLV